MDARNRERPQQGSPVSLSRRTFVGFTVGSAAALGLQRMACSANGAADARPNVLFIMADDLGREWLSCYGSEGHKTPSLDALAAGGVRFKTCYATPLCTPTRTELLTGRYGFRIGWSSDGSEPTGPKQQLSIPGWTQHWDAPRWGAKFFDWNKEITFTRMLKGASYATAIAGKWQVNDFRKHPDALKQHGFDEHCVWTGYETGNPQSGARYWDPFIQHNGERRIHKGEFGPDVFCDFIIDFMKRNKDKPFLLYYPMVLTHGPFVPTPLNKDKVGTGAAGKKGKGLLYPAMVDYVDYLAGRLVKALEDLKLRQNTVVFFTADNGSPGTMCRARGRQIKGGKGKMTEAGICVPMIVNCPGLIPGDRVSDDLIDFTDVLPTFAELARAPLPEGVVIDGQSFAPALLRKRGDNGRRQWIYSQLGNQCAVRDKRFKLYGSGQLYDLDTDPDEQHDLAGSAEPDAVAAREKLGMVLDRLEAEGAGKSGD